jgi:autotransporter-associated beta strand protein
LFLNGPIDLNGHGLAILLEYNVNNSRSRVDISGAISGSGDVTISAGENCTAQFNGTADNTFTGTLTYSGLFNEDKLVLNKTGGAVTHDRLVIGGVCQWEHPDQIGGAATVVVTDSLGYGAGKLYLQGHDQTLGALEFEEVGISDAIHDCLIDTGGGALGVRYHISTESDAGTPVIRGRLGLLYSEVTLDINGSEFYGLDVQANISGGWDITKIGTASLILSGSNSFTSGLWINGGTIEPRHPNALGNATWPVFLNGGALRLINLTIIGKPLFATAAGAVLFSQGASAWTGEVNLNPSLLVYGEDLALAGAISGSGGLSLLGATVTLSGSAANTFTGVTDVRCELLRLNKSVNTRAFAGPLIVGGSAAPLHEVRWVNNFQFPPAANVTVNPNGLLALSDFTDTVSNLTFNGGHVNLAADSALTVVGTVTSNPTNSTALIDGATGSGSLFLSGVRAFNIGDGSVTPDLRIDARVAGNGLVKNGAGMLSLGGNNVHSGATTINNGILRADHNNALGGVGTGTVVNNGATLWLGANAHNVPEGLTLNGNGFGGTNGALNATAAVNVNANVLLNSASTVRAESGASLAILGTITGTGPLSKDGSGTVTLSGNFANSYSGSTLVNAGTVQLDKPDFIQAVPGNLVIGGVGVRGTTSAIVRHFSQDQIWASVTVNAGSLLDLNGHDEYLLTLTLNGGGDVQTGTGLLTLIGNTNSLTVNPGIELNTSTISGRLGLRIGNHYVNVNPFTLSFITAPELDIPAQVLYFDGLANIHKSGHGDMRLSGSNTFTGVLYVNDGRVIAANNAALGTTSGSTVVQTNGTLALSGGITTGESLILDTAAPVALSSITGTNLATNNINLLRANTGVEVQTNNSLLILSGRIGSIGGLAKLGPGLLRMSGTVSNDYAGLTVVSNGVLEAGRANLVGVGFRSIPGDVILSGDPATDANPILRITRPGQMARDATATIDALGMLELTTPLLPATTATLRKVLGEGAISLGANTSLTISNDVSFDFEGTLTGAGNLVKRGIASMVLLGDSPSYAGTITVYDGRLRVQGSLPNAPVSVLDGGSLRGDGRVGAVTVRQDGIIAPDSKFPAGLAGDLETSALTNLAGGIVDLEFYGPSAAGGNDLVIVNGPVNLDGGLSAGIKYAAREGDVLTVISKTTPGAISGAFNNWAQGTTKILNELPVSINYNGGGGNDLTLTVTNLALRAAGFRIEGGNGDSIIDRNECNLIWLGLQSRRNNALSITRAELRSLSTAGLVTIAQASYPPVPPLGTVTNLTPFQLRTDNTLPCGVEGVLLELHVTVTGEGTFAVPFLLPNGDCTRPGGGGCESCNIAQGTFTTNSLRTVRVPEPVGVPSECLPAKPCPGPRFIDGGVRYVTHAFTNTSGNDACITAQLHYDCTNAPVGALLVAAYADHFVQNDSCQYFLGDAGALLPGGSPPFTFSVTNGGRFEIVVMQLIDVPVCPGYWIEVFGVPCPPPVLHIAKDAGPGNVRLHWSTAYPDWRLQSVNSLGGPPPLPFQNPSNAVSVVGPHYSVTNPASGAQKFYRLSKPWP